MSDERVLDLRADPDAALGAVVDHVRGGGLVAYPTETVYGLGAACTGDGVTAVRAAKPREADKPFVALVPSLESVADLGWTGRRAGARPDLLAGGAHAGVARPRRELSVGVRHSETGSVAVRVSPHPVAARLVAELGAPMISTSLNAPGAAPATSGSDAARVVSDEGWGDVFLLDAGTLPPSEPSTVLDCTGDVPRVLREGAVPAGRLRCAIPEIHDRTL